MAPKMTGFRKAQQIAVMGLSLAAASLALACNEPGIGDPCIPEDEYQTGFGGYAEKEVNVESRSFQCETRVCLVNKFRGRVSCKYGQTEQEANELDGKTRQCKTPDGQETISVPVQAQLTDRRPIESVYCSCRCAGINGVKDSNTPYCDCPSGFRCEDLVKDFDLGNKQLAGGYCVKEGTEKSPDAIKKDSCVAGVCGDPGDFYN